MALLRTVNTEISVRDGDPILEPARELGVPFSCHSGTCGTCRIEVVEGMEHLSPKTAEEEMLGCVGNQRQACQCRILSGTVTIQFEQW